MIFIKIALGVFFIALGWAYFFKPNLVIAINKIARESLFNDRTILVERKKLAIFFFCLSFVALYMGITSLTVSLGIKGKDSWVMETSSYVMYMAMQDYCMEKYSNAIQKYEQILKTEPDNQAAMRRLAYTHEVCGDAAKARVIWQRLLVLDPDNKDIMKKLKIRDR